MNTPAAGPTSGLAASLSMNRSSISRPYSISGMSLQALTSKVQTTKRKVYLLRYDGEGDEWTLQSGFDGDELFARPSIEFITVGPEVIHRAEERTESYEYCHPGDAVIPFDWLLAEVIGKHGPFEFILAEPARCPNCKHEITEKTLTDPRQD
jgi:hypothetical protein